MKRAADRAGLARFRELVRTQTGMTLLEARSADLERAVQRATAELGLTDADALYELLLDRPASSEALDALVSALNISETHFFRSADQIESLKQRILPELIDRRRPARRLRLWSAGCSTGEEPYTLAMLLARLLPDLAEWDVLILATDINGRSLERARRGAYRAWSLRGTSALELAPYLISRGHCFEVAPSIRAMVTFAALNLAEDVYPSPATNTTEMDLILCRNVLLYFDKEGTRAVVGRLRDALADGGSLLVSPTEVGLGVFDGLTQDARATGTYRKAEPQSIAIGGRRRPGPPPARRAPGPAPPAPASRPRPSPGPPAPASACDAATAEAEALALWRAGDPQTALRQIEEMTGSHPLAAPLHYLHGLLLLEAERHEEALAAFRRCTYADPACALGHLSQVGLFARAGLRRRALAALENSARLVDDLDADTVFSLGDGVSVGDILELIASQRQLLAEPDDAGSHG